VIKLSIFSDDLAADWRRSVEVAQEVGVQGLEIRNVNGKSSKDLTDDEARQMASVLKGTGLGISCMGSTYGRRFWLDDPESKRMTEDTLAKMIRFCEIFDTDKIRIFALWIPGYEEDRNLWAVRPRFNLDLLTRLVNNMETSVKMAEKAGVQLLIENEGNSYSGTCREARLIMEAVDSPAVQCIYHPRVSGLTGEGAYPEGYNQVREFVKHVHMGRLDYLLDGSEPTIPHRECVNALVADGYDGWITIERHFHPRDPEKMPELRAQSISDIKAVRQLLAEAQAPK
jgi:L-ribulose-5-phosphate 3-epimerase